MLAPAPWPTEDDHGMSDTAQGPGWWMASDGKWYPPELWTGPPNTGPLMNSPYVADPVGTDLTGTDVAGPDPAGPDSFGTAPTVTDAPAADASPTAAQPGQPPAYGAPAYPAQPPYGAAPYGQQPYGQPAYGQQPYQQQYGQPGQYAPYGQPMSYGLPPAKTNGLAIASLICSIVGIFLIPAVIGITFGFVARSQIKQSNGTQRGSGLALAGIIVGFGWAALLLLGIILNATNPPANNGSVIEVLGLLGRLV
jgi:hypothetical protein